MVVTKNKIKGTYSLPQKDYRDVHRAKATATHYQQKTYRSGSTDETIWRVEQQQLEDIVSRLVPHRSRYLDFACGTGRVIGFIGELFETHTGVDISGAMLEFAKAENPASTFVCGDICEDATLVGGDYDLITAFRFFLRAQPPLRQAAMQILAKKLASDGKLVFNIHNSRPSLLSVQNCITNLFKQDKVQSMSRLDVAHLVAEAGLETIETHELGVFPKALHHILGPKTWTHLDRTLCKIKILRRFASHVIYVCRRSPVARDNLGRAEQPETAQD